MSSVNERMEKAIESSRREWAKVRTGAASPAILDNVMVDYYGTPTHVSHVANITVPEPRTLVIAPWEKPMVPIIEKAILASNLGLTPVNDGASLRLNMPILTQERRQDLAKVVRKIAEEGRVALRNIRRDENDALKKMSKDELSEDELKKKLDEVQKITDSYVAKIDKLCAEKEADILKV
jgi:ribosome recycling factor